MGKEVVTTARIMGLIVQTHKEGEAPPPGTIRVETDSFLKGMAKLAVSEPDLSSTILGLAGLVRITSEDNRTYIRARGRVCTHVDIRGRFIPPVAGDTPQELAQKRMRTSSVSIDVNPNGSTNIYVVTKYIRLAGGQRYDDFINGEISRLGDRRRKRLGEGLLDVVAEQVAQTAII